MPSLFDAVEMAPRDPILGLNEQFNADTNPNKVNLGVGVYFGEDGKLPLLACVKAAEAQLTAAAKPRGYLPIDGIAAYDKAVQGLVFGADSAVLQAGRVATVQALGGTGGLKVGADFLKKLNPAFATVHDREHKLVSAVSVPTMEETGRRGEARRTTRTCRRDDPASRSRARSVRTCGRRCP